MSPRAMTNTPAPYNFVPHTKEVVIPSWEQLISHGYPLNNGISGSVKIKLTPQTPLIVADKEDKQNIGNSQQKVRSHFTFSDGTPGIPGSSLRGMLRSVVEIITHSKLSRMNDVYFGIRDLQNRKLYSNFMAKIQNGQITPLVNAGWLRPNPDLEDAKEFPAILYPCDYTKVEYQKIIDCGRTRGVSNYNPGQKQSAKSKYQSWFPTNTNKIDWKNRMHVRCTVEKPFSDTLIDGIPRISTFYRQTTKLGEGVHEGYLVFTGQPNQYTPNVEQQRAQGAGKAKHHDFIFLSRKKEHIKISKEIFEGFISAHSATGEQHRLTDAYNEELEFWMKQSNWGFCEKGLETPEALVNEIPVFFLMQKKSSKTLIRSIGLAQMFRLTYVNSTKDLAEQTWKKEGCVVSDETSKLPFDMTEIMFGNIHEYQDTQDTDVTRRILKGRIQIGHAHFKGKWHPLPHVTAVFGGPKATFYPYYIENGTDESRPGTVPLNKDSYKTYMDSGTIAQIRGYKRYLVRSAVTKASIPPRANDKVVTYFRPIKADGYFETEIVLHNMAPEEVGALVWALTFGGENNTFHQIGLAKSLGYGALKVEISENHLYTLTSLLETELGTEGTTVDLQKCMMDFETYMNRQVLSWSSSRRIYELIMMATPIPNADDSKAKHPELANAEYGNMFVGIKKAGLALSPRGSYEDYEKWKESQKKRYNQKIQSTSQQTEQSGSPNKDMEQESTIQNVHIPDSLINRLRARNADAQKEAARQIVTLLRTLQVGKQNALDALNKLSESRLVGATEVRKLEDYYKGLN